MSTKVIIIDYGSQVTQLIARRIREAGVYSEIHPCNISVEKIKELKPNALVLSGGPASVGEEDAPHFDKALLDLNIPTLAICYGMQLLAHNMGGELAQSCTREYGPADLQIIAESPLFKNIEEVTRVWNSHGDVVVKVPQGFEIIAKTSTLSIAAMADHARNIYAVQFHPEVHHSVEGTKMLQNFLFEVCKLEPDWTMHSFVDRVIEETREKVGDGHVICALSGGVDSTVVAVLLHKALGRNVHCIFVDNGVLRHGEGTEVVDLLKNSFDLNLNFIDASKLFLDKLKGVDDPEEKRKIIGYTFIEVFDAEAKKLKDSGIDVKWLAQGTLYPDVIESVSSKGPSAVIKSHHNVGGLPEKMNMSLIEPLRELFKDEVRKVGAELGIPDSILWRHPFPGPGLAIRILGEITEERLSIVRKADTIVQEELRSSGYYRKVWQGFAVLLPLKTVGVMGDGRTYEHVIALRVVDSVDAMTADWSRLPASLLESISTRIINEVKGVNRVVYDISPKPPSTIEWE